MEFIFGTKVIARDGADAGTLNRVLITPKDREVSHIIVKSPQASEDLLIPLNMVQGNRGDQLALHVTGYDLDNMPRYYEGRDNSPPAGRVDTSVVREPAERRDQLDEALNVADDAVDLGPETAVTTADKNQGTLRGLTADEYTNQLSRLHVEGIEEGENAIDARWVGDVRSSVIDLNATREQLNEPIRSDQASFMVRESGEPHDTVEPDQQG